MENHRFLIRLKSIIVLTRTVLPSCLLILLANVSFMSRPTAGDIIATALPQVPNGSAKNGRRKTQLVRSIWPLVEEEKERSHVVLMEARSFVTLKIKLLS